jgi:hypothetical protein
MKLNTSRICGALLMAGPILMVMSAAPSAQRGRRGGADANQGMPVATNTILQNPDTYYGKQVTVSAGVEQMLSKTSFLIDQWKTVGPKEVKSIGKPILVIAPYLTSSLGQKDYLLIRGEIARLDPTTIARVAADYKLDLSPEIGAKYLGQPVLLTTSVISSTYVELARKPIPPPSAAEISLDAAMKTINPAFAALRTGAEESKADVVTQNLAKLKPAFAQTETIWDDLGQDSAGQWAREALDQTASIERGVTAGDWGLVKTSAAKLNQLCQNCHGTFREREEDGTFRIKPGTF